MDCVTQFVLVGNLSGNSNDSNDPNDVLYLIPFRFLAT